MDAPQTQAAVAAAIATAHAFGLKADDAVVLQNANRLAVRLTPCDTLVRVARDVHHVGAEFEIDIAGRLALRRSPVGGPDVRVQPHAYVRDGFVVTFWTYFEPVPPAEIAPAEYAGALERLHAGMREVDLPTPHFTDRVAEAERIVGSHALSPTLGDADRELLLSTLRGVTRSIKERGVTEQLLHGEPHPGNVLRTSEGLRFIDLATCCRGPIEFDIAHAPNKVGLEYRGADQELVADCRLLMMAMVAAWRWDRNDRYPDGRRMGEALLRRIREARRQ